MSVSFDNNVSFFKENGCFFTRKNLPIASKFTPAWSELKEVEGSRKVLKFALEFFRTILFVSCIFPVLGLLSDLCIKSISWIGSKISKKNEDVPSNVSESPLSSAAQASPATSSSPVTSAIISVPSFAISKSISNSNIANSTSSCGYKRIISAQLRAPVSISAALQKTKDVKAKPNSSPFYVISKRISNSTIANSTSFCGYTRAVTAPIRAPVSISSALQKTKDVKAKPDSRDCCEKITFGLSENIFALVIATIALSIFDIYYAKKLGLIS